MGLSLGEITWYRGDSYPILLTLKSDTVAINLTGYAFILTVDSIQNPPDDKTKKFSVVGVVDPDQTVNTGKFTLKPTTTDTNIDSGTYYYDLQMTDPSGNIRTIAKDKWKMVQDITK